MENQKDPSLTKEDALKSEITLLQLKKLWIFHFDGNPLDSDSHRIPKIAKALRARGVEVKY